jgi:molybdopterin-guanine dinucleotide biosynthesis protein B
MNNARVLGLAGWSGSGKTTLLTRLIPLLTSRGLRIATLKHAHHAFEVDQPGKDSYEHRRAGACEVIVSSARRWVQMHELGVEAEVTLAGLLRRVSPCDLILVEGFKNERHPKLEVFRQGSARIPCIRTMRVVAVASDQAFRGLNYRWWTWMTCFRPGLCARNRWRFWNLEDPVPVKRTAAGLAWAAANSSATPQPIPRPRRPRPPPPSRRGRGRRRT